MRRFQKSTITEVAKRAGVSPTTVSIFVGGRESVCSVDTGNRIRAAIAELHYTPSPSVGIGQRRATNTIGVCINSPLDPHITFAGLFFERLWRGIVAEADDTPYALLHYPAVVRDSQSADPFLDGRVDGLLYHTHNRAGGDIRLERMVAAGMPTVILTRFRDLPDGCGAAYADESGTAALALAHLWERGHRRIAHIAGPTGRGGDVAFARRESYRDWLRARDAYDPALEAEGEAWQITPETATGFLRTWAALPAPPTAVFCANDALALTLRTAARAQDDPRFSPLALVGVDNTREAAQENLTSIEPPDTEVGGASFRALLRLIQGAPIAECRIAVPVTAIHLRESSAG